jgi:hypothetical protein
MSDLAGIAKDLNVPVERRGTIINSGTTSHFFPNWAKFLNFVSIPPQDIHMVDGSTLSAIGRGDVKVDLPLGQKKTTVTLKNALYTPKMAFMLISTNQITVAGLAVLFEGRMCKILSNAPKCEVIAEIPQIQGLYSVVTSRQHANLAQTKLTISDLHQVLGHVSQTAIMDAVKKGMVTGIDLDASSKPSFCDFCVKAKSARQLFPDKSKNCALMYGELVHTDLWGPVQMTSLGGCLYYISFMDNYMHQMELHFLKLKSEALTTFKAYEAWLGHQSPGA